MLDILFLFLCAVAAYLAWKALAKHLKTDKKAFDQEVALMKAANQRNAENPVTVYVYWKGD